MQNVNYKPSIPSPFQARPKLDPVKQAIEQSTGKFSLEVSIEEDKETAIQLKDLPGPIIAYKTTISRGSQILGIGRGGNILSKHNKWIDRSIRYTVNASIIDSIIQSCKALDVLFLRDNGEVLTQETIGVDLASDRQKTYLRELIRSNVFDEGKRKYWEAQVDIMTKDEASEKIQSLVNK
ncbi:MAG: hypothetical protein AAB913_03400 [Patescibacteria group bacterium]